MLGRACAPRGAVEGELIAPLANQLLKPMGEIQECRRCTPAGR